MIASSELPQSNRESGIGNWGRCGEMGRWGGVGRWGDGEMARLVLHTAPPQDLAASLLPTPCSLFPVPCSLFTLLYNNQLGV
ncbi:hypothetical protein BJP36_43330 [Moorena producens JHB]|uniref:Uncharacterized protein n=1 Tax=Moorena producens (strain JHB) TaxID=1454205 RepID=A0A9Q9UVV3_MOOP1|nr:hypothetical protein [Moorena producens]WAN69196.1 hypothetical protein BJP36_43330 [Moorena producens JHB]